MPSLTFLPKRIVQAMDAIQLNLLHNYQSNLALYDEWHEFFRNRQRRR
jgi:hypothetical protein